MLNGLTKDNQLVSTCLECLRKIDDGSVAFDNSVKLVLELFNVTTREESIGLMYFVPQLGRSCGLRNKGYKVKGDSANECTK